jgi:hypothetical protein
MTTISNQQVVFLRSCSPDISKEAAWPVRCGRPRPADGFFSRFLWVGTSKHLRMYVDVMCYTLWLWLTLCFIHLYTIDALIGFSYWKWLFSPAALNYQRVSVPAFVCYRPPVSNAAGKIPYKWRLIAGKTIEPNGWYSISIGSNPKLCWWM